MNSLSKSFTIIFMLMPSLFQAAGVAVYIFLIANIFLKGNEWFGPLVGNILGPILFLTLFVVSALITASLVLGYPIYLFWEKKKRKEAIKLVLMTTVWLSLFLLVVLVLIVI